MVQISRKDLERLAIGFGIADFLTEGALTKPIARSTKSALRKAAPAIGRGIIRYGPKVALTAARVTPTPLAAAAVGAAAIQNRERIADAAGNVYEMVAPAAQQYAAGVADRTRQFVTDPQGYAESIGAEFDPFRPIGGLTFPKVPKRKTSKFNQAVKRGMSIVKSSTSYGKKGTINNAKKAFTAVTKAASAVSKGRKAPKSGIRRKLHTAMSKILPKKKKQTKKKSKINITVYKGGKK
jgi:hypothetical protein